MKNKHSIQQGEPETDPRARQVQQDLARGHRSLSVLVP